MHRDPVPCLECDAPVPRRSRVCPACDYDVDRHDRRRLWLGAVGTAMTLSIVLAPIGLPVLWAAHRHRLAAAGSVGQRAEVPIGEHLRSVIWGFLTIERRSTPAADLRRAEARRGAVGVDGEHHR